jgi:predicted dehydrogenase|tara:strand:+ start:49523 stop:50641 length:1119 start_codon:yes stop_codon:yes gene_type:complete
MTELTHYGMIGCGMMGHEHIRNITLLSDTQVSVIFEPNKDMALKAKELAPNAIFVNSIDDLLDFKKLDCLVIVSPNFCHMSQLEQIALKRHLPILIEKPLFTDPNDIFKLEKFRDNYPSPVWVAMEYRYMPPIQTLRERVDSVTGGIKMLTIREHRFPFLKKVNDWNRFNRYSGGTLVEKCCHFFDLMRLLIKSEPTKIMASAGQSVNHFDEIYNGEIPDILDNGYVIVEFKNGARAMLELCMFAEGAKFQEEITAIGANGKIEALVPGPGRFWPKHLGDAPTPQIIISPRSPQGPIQEEVMVDPHLLEAGDHNGSTFYQHRKFLDLIRGKINQPEVTLMDGWKAVAMGLAAQKSALSGQVIDLSNIENYPI